MNKKIVAVEKALGLKEDGVWDDKDMKVFMKVVMPKSSVPAPKQSAAPPDQGIDPAALAGAAPMSYK